MSIQVDVTPIVNTVESIALSGFSSASAYADDAVTAVNSLIASAGTFGAQIVAIPSIEVELTPVANAIAAYQQPSLPVEPSGMQMNLPQPPAAFVVPTITTLSVGNVPEFTTDAPTLNMPAVPSALSASIPATPSLTDPTIPTTPDVTIPDVPTLTAINLPAAPTLNLPSFAETLAAAPTSPANTFAFTEDGYTSTLLTDLRAVLTDWVNGTATGLDPAVEQQIHNRERARSAAAAAIKAQEALRSFASRGFRKPPGALSIELQAAAQDAQDADLTSSREIAINQAKLEQDNRHFAIDKALQNEGQLIQYQGLVAQRAFEAAKYTQQIVLDIFTAEVQRFGAEAQAYSTKAQVFKTLIDAELSKLEVFKSELEAQKLVGELNVQQLEVFKARVSAIGSIVEVFKARVDAANVLLQGNKIRIESFATEVQAYDSKVRAKSAEYSAYEAQSRAEAVKVDLYRGAAEAYRAKVEGFAAGVTAQGKSKELEIAARVDAPLKAYEAAGSVFKTLSDGEASRVTALTKVYDSRAQVFDAQSRGEAARVGAETAAYKAASDVAVAEANLRLEAGRANVAKLTQGIGLLIELVKSGANVQAQVAASALSAMHVSTSLSASGQASVDYRGSESTSTSTSTTVNTNYSGSV